MKFYRNQPQADSHIYRSVFIEYVTADKSNEKLEQKVIVKSNANEPEVVSGRNTIYGTESRGDIIYFYNKIFVPKMQQFAMRFSTSSQVSVHLLIEFNIFIYILLIRCRTIYCCLHCLSHDHWSHQGKFHHITMFMYNHWQSKVFCYLHPLVL